METQKKKTQLEKRSRSKPRGRRKNENHKYKTRGFSILVHGVNSHKQKAKKKKHVFLKVGQISSESLKISHCCHFLDRNWIWEEGQL